MSDINTITVGGTQYNIGGSGGLLPHIVITSEAENTITVTTPSGSTITPTSTSSGVWECDVDEYGIYTIDATYDGHDAEETVNVDTVKVYPVEIHVTTVPDGKTVTPTDDISMWLACGQITGKSYTTLSQVLDDAETYERLLSDSNACDYMARSTTWANAGLVPKMTSDSAPSGEAFASSVYSGYPAYRAFDKDASTSWLAGSQSSPSGYIGQYVGYHFTSSVKICRVRIIATRYTEMVVEGSDDNSIYTPIDTITMSGSETATEYTFNINNSESYSYYRVRCSSAPTSNNPNIWELQFYAIADASIVDDADAMMRLGKYDYACDALLADSTWCTAICGSTYFEYVLDVSVPTMTSNTTPSGKAFASSNYDAGHPAYCAFDNVDGYSWMASARTDQYIGYIFDTPVAIKKCEWKTPYQSYCPSTAQLQGSNDTTTGADGTWTDIGSPMQGSTTQDEIITGTFKDNTIAYKAYRLFIASTIGGNVPSLDYVQFYGRHTAQTDIIVTAHGGDTVYYLDNGSPVTLTTADRDTGIGTVDWSDLPKGAITLYSGVAKNPSDLTADYSKTVYITEYTTQIYLMPDEPVLYWWGYESADLEDITSANGWSGTQVNGTVTHNTTSIYLNNLGGIGNKNAISAKTAHGIMESTSLVSVGIGVKLMNSKNAEVGTVTNQDVANTIQHLTYTNGNTYTYMAVNSTNASRAGNVYALWYE